MTTYTVQIQAGAQKMIGPFVGDTIWQAVHPAEIVSADDSETAAQIANWVADNWAIDGDLWRVCVWDGADADTGTEPAAVACSYEDAEEVTT